MKIEKFTESYREREETASALEKMLEKRMETEKTAKMLQGGELQKSEHAGRQPEIRRDLPNCREAMVTGNPFGEASKMDFLQGDNPYLAKGNCGLVSISNALRRIGIDVTEDDVTKYAIEKGLCAFNAYGDVCSNGGTWAELRQQIMRGFGVESDVCYSWSNGSLENIAAAIDRGEGVVISVNSDLLYGNDMGCVPQAGQFLSNHCVAVTGIAREAGTGEIKGVFIADSGRGKPEDACRYLTTEEFHEAYTSVYNSCANITRKR